MGGTVNVSAGGMDGGMDHESRGVEKTDRTGLVLNVTCVVDEKKVFRLDEREVLALTTNIAQLHVTDENI